MMIWVTDREQSCTYLSQGWLEFTGRTQAQEIGQGWLDGVHQDDRSRLTATLRMAHDVRERFRIEYRLRRWDGDYRWINNHGEPRMDSGGNFLGCISYCMDITDERRARGAVQKTNETLDLLLASSPAAMARLDRDGWVVRWNQAATRLLGWEQDELAHGPYRFVPALMLEPFRQNFERCLGGVAVTGAALQLQRVDGMPLDLSVSMIPVYNEDGEVNGALLTAQASADHAAEPGWRHRVLTDALRDTATALTSSLDPETVMQRILDNVGRVVPHDAANIMQIDGDVARVTHLHGYPSALTERLAVAEFSLDLPNYRKMLDYGGSSLIFDTFTDPNWIVIEDFDWIRAHISTPIHVDNQVVGFLNLDSSTPGAFSDDDVERLQAFADQVAIAIENARLYDALRRDADELKMLHRASAFLFRSNLLTTASLDDVARQFAAAVAEEYEEASCGVYLVDEQQRTFKRLVRSGDTGVLPVFPHLVEGGGLIAEATRSGRVIYAPDVSLDERYISVDPVVKSELVIPLRVGKEVIGALDLQSSVLDAFGEQDMRALIAFSERTAITMENVMLVGRIRRYTSELEERVSERTAELHRVKERVEAILNNSSDAILMVGEDGIIRQTNNAFNQMFEYPVDAVFGASIAAVVSEGDQTALESAIPRVIGQREVVRLEVKAVTRTGRLFDAEVMLSPIAEQDQRVLSFVCSLRDITARKRVEQELRNALDSERELSELKTRFITTASHEFRTPLAMIMTSSDILKNYNEKLSYEQRMVRIERIQSEVKNITHLLDDLLTLSRTGNELVCEPVELDVKVLCEQTVNDLMLRETASRRIEFRCVGEPTVGRLDPRLLRRILLNLISNALKFSLPNTAIYFTLTCAPQAKVFEIRDEGFGIPRHDQERLFEAFHRAKNVEAIGGTGLGLAIVKRAVEAHQGTITFSSQLGVGTTFTVTIPERDLKEGDDE